MANPTYYVRGQGPAEAIHAGVVATFVNWIGALVSLALVLGLVSWGYRLAVRDVSEIPVIRAAGGVIRVAPTDPGGEINPNKGLAVNTVQAGQTDDKPTERVVLAPPPVKLTTEDAPLVAMVPATKIVAPVPIDLATATEPTTPLSPEEIILAQVQDTMARGGGQAPENAVSHLPGVKISPRPRARPVVARAGPQAPGTAVVPNVDIALEDLPAGARLVQLGAYDDEAQARAEWDKLFERHHDLLSDKKRLIQVAESGGRSFYRLRAVGFADLGDARRMCSALLARATACIPVTAR